MPSRASNTVDEEAQLPADGRQIQIHTSESQDVEPIIRQGHGNHIDRPVEPQSEQQQISADDYSVFTATQKKLIVLAVAFATFFSPLSSAIYYPTLNTIATDLNVSNTQINLTITTYLIVQGVAPMMIAGFSDGAGRRPAYIICFTIYIAANLGLALQDSYAALLVLRCIQSAGSSGTVALSNGVISDMITSQERGVYIAFSSIGGILGPSIAPIIGGLLSQYLGWHWVFWFLLILSSAFFVPLLLFLPETCRKVVGNGAIPPPLLCMSVTDVVRHQRRNRVGSNVDPARQQEMRKNYKLKFPNPLSTLAVVTDKVSCLVLIATGLGLACFYAISTGAASQFKNLYDFNDIQIALMFIPIGAGGLISAVTTGKAVDWNYRRHAKHHGLPLTKNKFQDLSNFPIEAARLEIALPLFIIGAATILTYGWVMNYKFTIAAPIILLLAMGYSLTAAFQVLSILMVDIYPGKGATATAANNLVRCELGAASSAAIVPMIEAMGAGWAYTLLAGLFLAFTPALVVIMRRGIQWRREKRERGMRRKVLRMQKKADAETENRDGSILQGRVEDKEQA